jgi:hypothetical protein
VPSPARNLSTSVVAGAGTKPPEPATEEVAPTIVVGIEALNVSIALFNPDNDKGVVFAHVNILVKSDIFYLITLQILS